MYSVKHRPGTSRGALRVFSEPHSALAGSACLSTTAWQSTTAVALRPDPAARRSPGAAAHAMPSSGRGVKAPASRPEWVASAHPAAWHA